MTEAEYIKATNLVRIRAAFNILIGVVTDDVATVAKMKEITTGLYELDEKLKTEIEVEKE